MQCPECDTPISDDKRGKYHCEECNTNLVLTDHGIKIAVSPKHYTSQGERQKLVKHIRFTPQGEPNYTERCYFCQTAINKMVAIRGNVITVFTTRLLLDENGELVEKMVPKLKEVLACVDHLSQLNEVLPDKVVNPIEERYKYGRNEIRRVVKDVTCDSNKADPIDMSPCTTYIDLNGKCLYCKGLEVEHERHILGRIVRLERYNVSRG